MSLVKFNRRRRGDLLERDEHIVAEYVIDGVHVLVSDEAYIGKTEAELEAIRNNARQIAWSIYLKHCQEEE